MSTAQLKLFVDVLSKESAGEGSAPEELASANEQLREASGIDQRNAEAGVVAAKKRQPVLRRPIPAGLRRIDHFIAVPAAERPCPQCGSERKCIGHDTTEVIELIPAEVVVRVDRREKLACASCEGEIARAPVGDKVVAAGRLGTRLVSTLLVDKYDDGLPLNRTKQRLERMGLALPISTLADQVTWATDLLRPLWRLAVLDVLDAKVMHLDGTGLPVLDRDAPGGKRLGALWGYVGDKNVAAYLFASTGKKRGQKPGELGPEDMLANRSGYTVADASALFDESFKRDGIIECGCHMPPQIFRQSARCRRCAGCAADCRVQEALRDRGQGARPFRRPAQRNSPGREQTGVERDLRLCDTYKPHEPPSSKLGEAIRYLTNHRIPLGRFLEDGVIPIDNGIVERLHVRAALTRKNFLFAGSDAGGERAAIAYTILGCCRLAKVNPVEYLADVLPRLARRVRLRDMYALMPARWHRSEPAAAVTPGPVAAHE